MIIILLAVLGFFICVYDFIIEQKLKKDAAYKPACDLNENISCSKPILSPYGKLWRYSNALLGMMLYASIFIFALANLYTFVFIFSGISVLVSIYLAYILVTKIKSFCLVCVSVYTINVLLFLLSWFYL